jgi:hypothetical protein
LKQETLWLYGDFNFSQFFLAFPERAGTLTHVQVFQDGGREDGVCPFIAIADQLSSGIECDPRSEFWEDAR